MWRTWFGGLLVLLGLTVSAPAQNIFAGAGSTFQGDYLRGCGIAAWGMGLFNYDTAMANSINVDAAIRLNEYVMGALRMEAIENAEHRKVVWERHLADYKKIRDRILNSPEAGDVLDGNTLNALLVQLQRPEISDSTFRLYQVPLDPDVVRKIPFKFGDKGETFSLGRLSLKSTKKWMVEFQDPHYDSVRENYQRAVDAVLDLAIEGKMTDAAIQTLKNAVARLENALADRKDIDQRLYEEASGQMKMLNGTIRLFETHGVQQALAAIDKEPVTNVFEMKIFMQKYRLTFAPAKTPDERKLYPQLQTALREQRDHVTAPAGEPDK